MFALQSIVYENKVNDEGLDIYSDGRSLTISISLNNFALQVVDGKIQGRLSWTLTPREAHGLKAALGDSALECERNELEMQRSFERGGIEIDPDDPCPVCDGTGKIG